MHPSARGNVSDSEIAANSVKPELSGKQKTACLTSAVKAKLHAYFTSCNWPLNRILPKGEAFRNGELGRIVFEHNLNRDQVVGRLQNFKDAKYGNSQIKLILEVDDLKEKMRRGFPWKLLSLLHPLSVGSLILVCRPPQTLSIS